MMSDNYVILKDIQGIEDFYGDMDFKVADKMGLQHCRWI